MCIKRARDANIHGSGFISPVIEWSLAPYSVILCSQCKEEAQHNTPRTCNDTCQCTRSMQARDCIQRPCQLCATHWQRRPGSIMYVLHNRPPSTLEGSSHKRAGNISHPIGSSRFPIMLLRQSIHALQIPVLNLAVCMLGGRRCRGRINRYFL
jgi:hypothetical protein